MNLEKIKKVTYNLRSYTIYGTVRGLFSESEDIKKIFDENKFDLVMLGISPEDLEGLKVYIEKPFEVDLSDYEIIYGLKLQNFGKVKMPIPSFTSAIKIAQENGINILAIDMNENEYANAFTGNVKFFDILRHTYRKKRILKKDFKAQTPEEFSIKWDMEINKLKGYAKLEKKREEYMADKIKNNTQGSNIFVIIDYERMNGIIKNLKGDKD
ncbi:MAG: hypothetical protein ACP5LA_02355 [Thermoplasmata archaeon]|nr:hypothetical protein [Thermoplasmata archaeon]